MFDVKKDYNNFTLAMTGCFKIDLTSQLTLFHGFKEYQCILLSTISSFLRRSHNRMSQEYWYMLRFRDSHSMMWDTRRDLRKNQQYHWYQRIQYYNCKKMILRLTMVQKWLKTAWELWCSVTGCTLNLICLESLFDISERKTLHPGLFDFTD